MEKRGQVTIFVIIAVVVIAIFLVYFLFISHPAKSSSSVTQGPVFNFVQNCLENATQKAVIDVGLGGGYFYSSPFSTPDGIAYYWLNGTDHFLNMSTLQSQVSEGISKSLSDCISNFTSFPGYTISAGTINVSDQIESDKVYVFVNYPVTISKGSSTDILKTFDYKMPSRLGLIHNLMENFTSEEPKNPGICLSCIYGISNENNLTISMFDYSPTTVIFDVKDNESKYKIGSKDFEFVFANNYTNGL